MLNQIVLTSDGFEIIDFDHRKLSHIGALFYMRFVGYVNISEIKEALKRNPADLQKRANDFFEEKHVDLFHLHHLNEDVAGVEIFIGQNIFSPHGEFKLYINVEKADFVRAKRILYTIIDEP